MIARWLQARREAKLINALVLLKMEELRRMTTSHTILKSPPYYCREDDCDSCKCDCGPDCD